MKHYFLNTTLICIALILLCVVVQPASAISIGMDRLLGFVDPSTPCEEENVVTQVNFLIDAYNDNTATRTALGDNPADPGDEYYYLWFSDPATVPGDPITLIPDPVLPTVTAATKTDSENPHIDLGTMVYQWILAKYGRHAYVYYIGDISGGEIELPATGMANGNTISHYALVDATNVPDGGTTAVLLGLACIAIGSLRSRHR